MKSAPKKRKFDVAIGAVMDKSINDLERELTSLKTREIHAFLTVKGHDYWFYQEYGTATRHTPETGLSKPSSIAGRKMRRQRDDAGVLRGTGSKRGAKYSTAMQVKRFNARLKIDREKLENFSGNERLNLQRSIDQRIRRWRQRTKGKARLSKDPEKPGWYLIQASAGKNLRFNSGGATLTRSHVYHPGIRPWVVNGTTNNKTRSIYLGFGPETAGLFTGKMSGGKGVFVAGEGRGLIRVLLYRTQRKIIAEIIDEMKRQRQYVAAGFPKEPNYAIRNVIVQAVDTQMRKLVETLRRKTPRGADNPDTLKRSPGSALADAWDYRMPPVYNEKSKK